MSKFFDLKERERLLTVLFKYCNFLPKILVVDNCHVKIRKVSQSVNSTMVRLESLGFVTCESPDDYQKVILKKKVFVNGEKDRRKQKRGSAGCYSSQQQD